MAQAEFEYEGVAKTWLNHAPVWTPLNDADDRAAWDLLYQQFRFQPSARAAEWPSIVLGHAQPRLLTNIVRRDGKRLCG